MNTKKACDCKSSSSGPRCVVVRTEFDKNTDSHSITVAFVQMACDKCNKAWEIIDVDS